jgi:ParB/RepB/Spo0J family partition protein
MPQQKLMKTSDILLDGNVRKTYEPVAMAELTASVKAHGVLQPLLVMLSGRLLAGHRRLKAATAAGLESVPVIITDELLSDSQVKVIQLTENMQRADLSGFEKWTGCYELMCMNPTWQMQDLAECLHIGPSMVTRLLSPSKCVEAAQNALRDGKIGISDCYAISKLPAAEQAGLLALKLSGASRDDIEQAGRKSRKNGAGAAQTIKLARIRCPLSTGTMVVVSGAEMDLEGLIEALSSALDAARKASKDRATCLKCPARTNLDRVLTSRLSPFAGVVMERHSHNERKLSMFKLKLLAIIVIGVCAWWVPDWAEHQANRLEQEGTGGDLGCVVPPPVPRPVVAAAPEKDAPQGNHNAAIDDFPQPNPAVDDFPLPRAVLEPDPEGAWVEPILVPVDPADKEKLRQAGIYRNVSNVTKGMWWYLPVGLAALLVLSQTTSVFKRRPAPVEEVAANDAGDKLDMEALLAELEKLRQAKPALPEAGKEVIDEKRIVDS